MILTAFPPGCAIGACGAFRGPVLASSMSRCERVAYAAIGSKRRSEISYQLQDRAARLWEAAALRALAAEIGAEIAADRPMVREIIARRDLRQGRSVIEIDVAEGGQFEVADEGIGPIRAQKDLLARPGLLLVAGIAPDRPKLARDRQRIVLRCADCEPAPLLDAGQARLVIVIFEIEGELRSAGPRGAHRRIAAEAFRAVARRQQ